MKIELLPNSQRIIRFKNNWKQSFEAIRFGDRRFAVNAKQFLRAIGYCDKDACKEALYWIPKKYRFKISYKDAYENTLLMYSDMDYDETIFDCEITMIPTRKFKKDVYILDDGVHKRLYHSLVYKNTRFSKYWEDFVYPYLHIKGGYDNHCKTIEFL